MKHSLQLKFLAGYILFVSLGFLTIATLGSNLVGQYVSQETASSMKRTCEQIGELFQSAQSADSAITDDVIQTNLDLITDTQGYTIWILNWDGTTLLSSKSLAPSSVTFDSTGFLSYVTDAFPSILPEGTISVYQALSASLGRPARYVLAHCPREQIIRERESILAFSYQTLLVVTGFTLLLLVVFHFIVSKPLRKITRTAKEYAAGNFSYEMEVHSRDEMGYLADTLGYMATRISDVNEDQKRFIANVSHDFRSPLTSIKGYIEAIQDGTIPTSMQDKYLGIVLDETKRLEKLTRSLLALNTFDDKGIYLDRTSFDVHFIIKKILATFERRCQDKAITFDLIFDEREQYVYADMGKIQQVLYNLIDNAIKFSDSGSSIVITSHIHHEKVFLSVKDHGVGIQKESITKIWDRFYKTDTSRGKDKQGTGLGLAIVRDIIKAHNENIDVISTPSVGTEFIFSLPIADKKGAQ